MIYKTCIVSLGALINLIGPSSTGALHHVKVGDATGYKTDKFANACTTVKGLFCSVNDALFELMTYEASPEAVIFPVLRAKNLNWAVRPATTPEQIRETSALIFCCV